MNSESKTKNFRGSYHCSCSLFNLAIAGKASPETFILESIRENNCISLVANDIIIIYLCQNITEL